MIEIKQRLRPALAGSHEHAMASNWTPGVGTAIAHVLARALLKAYRTICVGAIRARRQADLPAIPKIIAANHPNVTDAFVLPFVFPDRLICLAQADLFEIPILGRLLAATGSTPAAARQPLAALAAARRRIEQGYSLFLFPEGRLNDGGPLRRGHTGAIRLALSSGAPIVPVGFYVAPRHLHTFARTRDGKAHSGRWQLGGPIYVEIGAAWWPGRELAGSPSARDFRRLTARLMEQIATLASQAEDRAEEQTVA